MHLHLAIDSIWHSSANFTSLRGPSCFAWHDDLSGAFLMAGRSLLQESCQDQTFVSQYLFMIYSRLPIVSC